MLDYGRGWQPQPNEHVVIAIPIQCDAIPATVTATAANPERFAELGEAFAQALLEAVGKESPASGVDSLESPRALKRPDSAGDEEKNELPLPVPAVNLMAPAIVPIIDTNIARAVAAVPSCDFPAGSMPEIAASDSAEFPTATSDVPAEREEATARYAFPAPAAASGPEPAAPVATEAADAASPPPAPPPPSDGCVVPQSVAPEQPEDLSPVDNRALSSDQPRTRPPSAENVADAGEVSARLLAVATPEVPGTTSPRVSIPAPKQIVPGSDITVPKVATAREASSPHVSSGVLAAPDATVTASGMARLEAPKRREGVPASFLRAMSVAAPQIQTEMIRLRTALHRDMGDAAAHASPAKSETDAPSVAPDKGHTLSVQVPDGSSPPEDAGKAPDNSTGPEITPLKPVGPPATQGIEAAGGNDKIVSPPPSPSSLASADSHAVSSAVNRNDPVPAESAPTPAPPPSPVQLARMVDRAGQAEMHIGLRTTMFGNVEVHTVVRDSQVGVAVGTEKGDLRGLMSTEVPALQASFHQHDLQLDSIRFLDHGPGFDMGFSTGADAQSRSFQQGGRPLPALGPGGLDAPSTESAEVQIARDLHAGLNVHA